MSQSKKTDQHSYCKTWPVTPRPPWHGPGGCINTLKVKGSQHIVCRLWATAENPWSSGLGRNAAVGLAMCPKYCARNPHVNHEAWAPPLRLDSTPPNIMRMQEKAGLRRLALPSPPRPALTQRVAKMPHTCRQSTCQLAAVQRRDWRWLGLGTRKRRCFSVGAALWS